MQQYIIWWKPSKQNELLTSFPELEINNSAYEEPTVAWPAGFHWVEQDLSPEQFAIVDNLADTYVAIDVKPTPFPPGSPTGR